MTRHGSILVIDDEEIMREILETLLVREGYQVRLATNGTQGIELARSMPFDAAIVDVMLPRLDGLALIDRIRARIQGPVERLVVEGAGHSPQFEAPEEVLRAIAAFSDRLP